MLIQLAARARRQIQSPIFLIPVGMIFVLVGCYSIYRGFHLLITCRTTVIGKVKEIVIKGPSKGSEGVYYGVAYTYEYEGKSYSKSPTIYLGSYPNYSEGDPYEIKINAKKPEESYNRKWYMFIILGVISLIMGVTAVLVGKAML